MLGSDSDVSDKEYVPSPKKVKRSASRGPGKDANTDGHSDTAAARKSVESGVGSSVEEDTRPVKAQHKPCMLRSALVGPRSRRSRRKTKRKRRQTVKTEDDDDEESQAEENLKR